MILRGELPGISRVLPCIAAYASSWGIHHWQRHLFTTFVIFRARFAQASLVFLDALSTDAGSRFPTHIASVIDSFASFSCLAVSLVVAVEVALVVDAAQTRGGAAY